VPYFAPKDHGQEDLPMPPKMVLTEHVQCSIPLPSDSPTIQSFFPEKIYYRAQRANLHPAAFVQELVFL
jgi:hypothetical protein